MTIVSSLLGEAPGEMLFKENPDDPSLGAAIPASVVPDQHCYRVPVTTIDAFVAEKGLTRVDFLKIDVEAYEFEVLRGGVAVIREHRPKIAIAAYHRPSHAVEIRKILIDIDSSYKFKVSGLVEFNNVVRPVMLHCYV